MRLFLVLILLASPVVLGACGNGEASSPPPVRATTEGGALPYDLDAPDARFELPGRLDEISGLTALDSGRLGAVQDEQGDLFVLDVASGEIVHTHDFGGGGDYEGVELVGESVVVLRSDGRLFVIDDWTGKKEEARSLDTGLHGSCDAEGLGFDAEATRMLIACKESPGRGYRGSRALYAFDPASNRLDPAPAFVIRADSLALDAGAADEAVRALIRPVVDLNTFKPSAVAVHPRTGQVYVLSSVREVLVVLDRTGALAAVWPLPDDLLAQPEGLTFLPDGTLFIASEAGRGAAVLLRFDHRPR